MQRKTMIAIASLAVVVSFIGCGPTGFPRNKYSGDFSAINRSDRDVHMLDCSGFGWASPQAGILIPNAKAGLHFSPLDSFPEKTTIRWRDESDGKEYEQTVELADVVPRGVEGTTALEFTADLKWTVRFVPGSEDHGPE